MIGVTLTQQANFEEWKTAARTLLCHKITPDDVVWSGPGSLQSLFSETETTINALPVLPDPPEIKVPSGFIAVARRVICHRDTERFARLYRILWRLRQDRHLLSRTTDPDIIWMTECDKAIRRDRHKMHAFVRFRKVGEGRFKREQFSAWFEPSHYITELATPFFMRRFPNMDWIIVTPDKTAVWDGQDLKFCPGGRKSDVPLDDAMEDHWSVYFKSIFNPARLKVGAMMAEMPKKYWHNMPEAKGIPDMIAKAREREHYMTAEAVSEPHALAATLKARRPSLLNPSTSAQSLSEARQAIQSCRFCPLYCDASQAVFGEGPDNARIMIVGEQPGDEEDIAGRPFVGPAGKVFNDALEAIGIDRSEIYVTNAVKHFKFKVRDKRRIHQRPSASEIDHCRWWIRTEWKLVKPDVIVAMGASAARSVLGRSVKVSEVRGNAIALKDGTTAFVTVHPSYILRLTDPKRQQAARQTLVDDIKKAVSHATSPLLPHL